MVVSLVLHAILAVVALSFVAVTVITKEEKKFEAKQVSRPKMPPRKLQVPVKIKKQKRKPKLRQRIVVKTNIRNMPYIKMPEISGIKGGMGTMGGSGLGDARSIGFTMPEIDFFGARAKAEKVCFIIHFGPATIGETPLSRMTGYTIRKRLEDMVNRLPNYTLFNVACFFINDTWAMSPKMLSATPANKQKVMDWMEPVNPLEGNYDHCFWRRKDSKFDNAIRRAAGSYPTRVDEGIPFYAPKWMYPYVVSSGNTEKYLSEGKDFIHWNRAVAWAILEQKPDAIFILTTNYIDGWGTFEVNWNNPSKYKKEDGQPAKMMESYKKMFLDIYGLDRKKWPTINVVVLKRGRADPKMVLNDQFGPLWKKTGGDGSVITDITRFMNDEEAVLYRKYQEQYGSQ